MLFSEARSARIACWLSELSRLSSSRSSVPNPGPRRTRVAPSKPPMRAVKRIFRSWRMRIVAIGALPGACRLEFEAPRHDHFQFLFLFRQVHATIRLAEQAVGVGAILGEDGVADTKAQRDIADADDLSSLSGNGLKLLDFLSDLILLEAGQDQDELVAAHARDIIVLAAAFLQPFGNTAQQAVAFQMAQLVVDLLEAVHVTDQHDQRGIQTSAARELAIEM